VLIVFESIRLPTLPKALPPEFFDRIRVDQVADIAEGASTGIALAQRLALISATPSPGGHQRGFAPGVFQADRGLVALDADAVMQVLGGPAVVLVVQQAGPGPERQASGFPAVGRRGIHVEGPAGPGDGLVHEPDRPAVEAEVAVGAPEAVALPVVEGHQVAKLADGAVEQGVRRVQPVAARDVLGAQRNGPVATGLVGDVIEGTRRLRPIHQRSAAADELEPVDRLEGRREVHGGVAVEIEHEGQSVLEHQQVLGLMRVADAPVAEAEQAGIR